MERHLRLVRPKPPKRPPKRTPPLFSPEESARIRAALRNARAMFGTWACLADAMHLRTSYVGHVAGGRRVTGRVVIRLARALGVPAETLWSAPTDAKRCAACGRST